MIFDIYFEKYTMCFISFTLLHNDKDTIIALDWIALLFFKQYGINEINSFQNTFFFFLMKKVQYFFVQNSVHSPQRTQVEVIKLAASVCNR